APLFEKSHDSPGPGPLEGQVQAGIEQGIVAQCGKVLRVLTQDTEVLAGAAELQIVAARPLAGNPGRSVGGRTPLQQGTEQTQGPREPPAQAADERVMLLPIKFRFIFQLTHACVERGKLDILSRRLCRATRARVLLAARATLGAGSIAVARSRRVFGSIH